MRKLIIITIICIAAIESSAQTVSQKLVKAYQQFEKDPQLKHAISSLYVIDASTGKVVCDKNSMIGLAPASSQKVITAVTSFELLGKDYKYETILGYIGDIVNSKLKGNLVIIGSGDPTFGSWRWQSTSEENIIKRFTGAIKKIGIEDVSGSVYIDKGKWETQLIPDGWVFQDLGNYYGAGVDALNWRENQVDVFLKSGKNIGDSVKIVGVNPKSFPANFTSEITSSSKGSGDNAYVYFNEKIIRGTIPVMEDKFSISASIENPSKYFLSLLSSAMMDNGIDLNKPGMIFLNSKAADVKIIYSEKSPTLDSIIYWFLKKSINLYGEALIKTIAYEKKGFGATDTGINIVKSFWKQKGLDPYELNLYDGSGLSPLNRITTHAQVEILKYAKKQNWFRYFYEALPEYNGMKLKSGTISDVKSFCGYHKAKDGKEYILSFIVNNYTGNSSTLVNKMYRVLDVLK